MRYVMCGNCGRRLCKAESATQAEFEIECPKCGESAVAILKGNELLIRPKPQRDKPPQQ